MDNAQNAARLPSAGHIELVGAEAADVRLSHNRLAFAALAFVLCFVVLAGRLVELTAFYAHGEPTTERVSAAGDRATERADIVDRHGSLLATNLATASLYADPAVIADPVAAADALRTVLPDLDRSDLLDVLASNKRFVWIKRRLTPRQQYAVNSLGVPGLQFQHEERRVYPHGALAAHILGHVDVEGEGRAGVERFFQDQLIDRSRGRAPLALTVDMRVQHVVHDELRAAMTEFKAVGAAGVVLDANTGEVISLVSLPDFDPNNPGDANKPGDSLQKRGFNRATFGVYELGSVFKAFTVAMALDKGTVTISDGYDATKPLRVSRFTIRDDHPKKRWLSVPEILIYSSNIGAAQMALDVGSHDLLRFLDKVGMLSRPGIELPELGRPQLQSPWRDINTMTAAYGHGVAVSPMQMATGFAALVNGGVMVRPTLLPLDGDLPVGTRVISQHTSMLMRKLLRLVVTEGTGGSADVPGLLVGGKTGTAEKPSERGGYNRRSLLSSFIAAFPMNDPKYVVYAMLDEPKGNKKTHGFASAGWTAAPTAGRIISRIAPLLDVRPVDEEAPEIRQAMDLPSHSREPKLASVSAD